MDHSVVHGHQGCRPLGLLTWLCLCLSMDRAVWPEPTAWPPLPFLPSVTTIGRAAQGWTRDGWSMWGYAGGAQLPHLREWNRDEVVYENTLVKHKNAVWPWDMPPWASLILAASLPSLVSIWWEALQEFCVWSDKNIFGYKCIIKWSLLWITDGGPLDPVPPA